MFDPQWLHPYAAQGAAQSAAFRNREPFPWWLFEAFLDEAAFRELHSTYPDRDHFELHQGIRRPGRQRSHDRYYLAYEQRAFRVLAKRTREGQGVIHHDELSPAWQAFIEALRSDVYHGFLGRMLGAAGTLRFAWHLGFQGSDVSPHLDDARKLGTHIFYFNDPDEWSESWGGQTLILGGKQGDRPNPEVSEFGRVIAPPMVGNRSLLFQRTADSWHAVEPLRCPAGRFRRTFHAIVER